MTSYLQAYARAADDPEGFWREHRSPRWTGIALRNRSSQSGPTAAASGLPMASSTPATWPSSGRVNGDHLRRHVPGPSWLPKAAPQTTS